MYQYPRLEGAGSVIASRSFYRADDVKFSWNKKGFQISSYLSRPTVMLEAKAS